MLLKFSLWCFACCENTPIFCKSHITQTWAWDTLILIFESWKIGTHATWDYVFFLVATSLQATYAQTLEKSSNFWGSGIICFKMYWLNIFLLFPCQMYDISSNFEPKIWENLSDIWDWGLSQVACEKKKCKSSTYIFSYFLFHLVGHLSIDIVQLVVPFLIHKLYRVFNVQSYDIPRNNWLI